MLEHELDINEYQVYGGGPYHTFHVVIRRRRQLKGPDLWAVICNNTYNLNKKGEWQREPRPSSRSDAFIANCRFTDQEDAYKAWQISQAKQDLINQNIVEWHEVAYCMSCNKEIKDNLEFNTMWCAECNDSIISKEINTNGS